MRSLLLLLIALQHLVPWSFVFGQGVRGGQPMSIITTGTIIETTYAQEGCRGKKESETSYPLGNCLLDYASARAPPVPNVKWDQSYGAGAGGGFGGLGNYYKYIAKMNSVSLSKMRVWYTNSNCTNLASNSRDLLYHRHTCVGKNAYTYQPLATGSSALLGVHIDFFQSSTCNTSFLTHSTIQSHQVCVPLEQPMGVFNSMMFEGCSKYGLTAFVQKYKSRDCTGTVFNQLLNTTARCTANTPAAPPFPSSSSASPIFTTTKCVDAHPRGYSVPPTPIPSPIPTPLPSPRPTTSAPTQPTFLPTAAPTNTYVSYCGASSATASSMQLSLALRAMNLAYTGPLLTLRRSSDNAVMDFYADGAGNLGSSVGATGTSYASWIGTSTGYVAKWWDQSGVGNHATQTTTTLQGTYDPVNKYVDFTNSGWMNLPDGTIPYGNNPYTIVAKHGVINNANGDIIGQGYQFHSNKCCTLRRMDTQYRHFYWGNDYDFPPLPSSTSTYTPGNIVSVSYDQSYRRGWVNNAYVSQMATSNRDGESQRAMLANDDPGDVMQGQIYFVFVSNVALANSERLALENIMSC